jgi:hypothetical protein
MTVLITVLYTASPGAPRPKFLTTALGCHEAGHPSVPHRVRNSVGKGELDTEEKGTHLAQPRAPRHLLQLDGLMVTLTHLPGPPESRLSRPEPTLPTWPSVQLCLLLLFSASGWHLYPALAPGPPLWLLYLPRGGRPWPCARPVPVGRACQ